VNHAASQAQLAEKSSLDFRARGRHHGVQLTSMSVFLRELRMASTESATIQNPRKESHRGNRSSKDPTTTDPAVTVVQEIEILPNPKQKHELALEELSVVDFCMDSIHNESTIIQRSSVQRSHRHEAHSGSRRDIPIITTAESDKTKVQAIWIPPEDKNKNDLTVDDF